MSKKSLKQNLAPAGIMIVTKAGRAGKRGRAAGIGADENKAVPRSKTILQSKSERVLALLKRASGATLDELMKATTWQAHSVRGSCRALFESGRD